MSAKYIVYLAVLVFATMASATSKFLSQPAPPDSKPNHSPPFKFLSSTTIPRMTPQRNSCDVKRRMADLGRLPDTPHVAKEAGAVNHARGIENNNVVASLVARQVETVTVTAISTICGCGPAPVPSTSSSVSQILSTETPPTPAPVPVTSSSIATTPWTTPTVSPPASTVVGTGASSVAKSSSLISSAPKVTPSTSSTIPSSTPTPPPSNDAIRNSGIGIAILAGAVGFVALVAM
ncbi:uncharacterized protein PADG_00984 [Paracoccidioides brasiliensis Pb18]|uniref:Uncharacterized protein n=1 Tax=Paracoccidioides brasiliensis (strain Pb18) TaxID=502780 RepID=C1FYV8_PARBD|nr:uncharacterized protein PADG_00984 [Paracoccidioides brasiliensis Pb18]EEH44695.2 hypothetical protein PADG_00984 [Paracoccidioides brasiliensis Pb18]